MAVEHGPAAKRSGNGRYRYRLPDGRWRVCCGEIILSEFEMWMESRNPVLGRPGIGTDGGILVKRLGDVAGQLPGWR